MTSLFHQLLLLVRDHQLHADIIFQILPKLFLTALPKRSIAVLICSLLAEANVVRKCKPGKGLSFSVRNQEPRATSTPFSMHESKISASMSSMLRVLACGCFE